MHEGCATKLKESLMQRMIAALALCVGFLAAAPAAQAETIYARDVDKILAIAQSYGSAELTTGNDGRPMIQARMENVTYLVLFYGCRNGKDCTDIQFGALWDAKANPSKGSQDLVRANQWNTEKRFGNAYIDTDGTVIIKMEVNIEYGAERRTVEGAFDWWRLALQQFPEFYFK